MVKEFRKKEKPVPLVGKIETGGKRGGGGEHTKNRSISSRNLQKEHGSLRKKFCVLVCV